MRARVLSAGALLAVLTLIVSSCGDSGSPNQPTPTCSFTVSPGTNAFGPEGGTGSVTVSTAAGCAWSVTGAGGWITIASGSSGSGDGSVSYSVSSNSSSEARTGTLTIGGQTHGISQRGRSATACTYELSPQSAQFNKDAAAGTFAVTAPDTCTWSARSSAPWLAVSSGEGTGNGSVAYTVARNVDVAERTATITLADRTFSVRQSGDLGVCQYSVAPVDLAPCMPGGTVTANLTTQAGCSWTVAPNASWLGLPGGSSGTGPAVIAITYADNYDAPRDGIVMVRWPTPTAGQNIRVAQAGCLYSVSQSAIAIAAAGGSASFNVFQQAMPNTCGGATQDRCVWDAQADVPWITITSGMPRTGDNPVAFTVASNAGAARTGRIRVRDKVVVISQAGQ